MYTGDQHHTTPNVLSRERGLPDDRAEKAETHPTTALANASEAFGITRHKPGKF